MILVQNCETSRSLLEEWDRLSADPIVEKYRYGDWHEQSCFNEVILPKYRQQIKVLYDYYLMNGFHGIFIRHFNVDQVRAAQMLKEICLRRSAFHKYLPLLD